MNIRSLFGAAVLALSLLGHAQLAPTQIPEPLKPWQAWSTYKDRDAQCPMPYDNAQKRLCVWPSRLTLQVAKAGARLELSVNVYSDAWLALPFGKEAWPNDVRANGAPLPVVEHGGAPAIRLTPGAYKIAGSFQWHDIPQSLTIPREIGLLALTVEGQPVENPAWDAEGQLWLKRTETAAPEEAPAADRMTVKVFRLLEDGIPLSLESQVELTVSGKSREEVVGRVLPEGWKLSALNGPIPVAIDAAGVLKAQVRPGKWTISFSAFRADNPKTLTFGVGAKSPVASELIAFKAQPQLRTVEITGAPAVDVSQLSFPAEWSSLPVYRWDTRAAGAAPLRLEERMRGPGEEKTAGLSIARQLWLDENGAAFTFHDRIMGEMQRSWRLDAAPGYDLGSVRLGSQPQLITLNPATHTAGVEIRSRDLDLEAVGRLERHGDFAASGWLADPEKLHVTVELPPGWRLFALFGADYVHGDWLTTWTLLDLFVVLVIALAVFRLGGWALGLVALFGLALTYHEPEAPRMVWIGLLVALALLRVVKEGWARKTLLVAKWVAVGVFMLIAVPFIAQQLTQAIYPQLEERWDHRSAERITSASLANSTVNLVEGQIRDFRSAAPGASPAATPRAAKSATTGTREIQHKLETIIIPKLELRDATVREAIDYLKQRVVALDPEHRGINMVVRFDHGDLAPALPPAAPVIPGLEPIPGAAPAPAAPFPPNLEEARITVSLNNIPLGEALRYITGLANLKYKVEPNAVAIVSQSMPTDVLVTKEWKVPPGFLAGQPQANPGDPLAPAAGGIVRRMEVKDYLTSMGMTFPAGTSAIFLPSTSTLILKNTEDNLNLMDAIVEQSVASGAPAAAADNMSYDLKTRLQSGPGLPTWNWRTINFGWNGPVQKDQRVHAILISSGVERFLTLLRVGLLVALAGGLLGARDWARRWFPSRTPRAAALVAALLALASSANAQTMPTDKMIETLRERLLEAPDAFPHAADFPSVSLKLADRRLTMDVEIHAAARCAVPLPGKLPGWSPLTVTVDDKAEPALRREDGFLWVVLEPGIHRAHVEAQLGPENEWQWSYRLKPHRVQVEAPGWTVTGVRPSGAPEQQVFFALEKRADAQPQPQKAATTSAAYDRPDLQPALTVERRVELGLIWMVHNRVVRHSPIGRAVSVNVTLLPGEDVLTSATVKQGAVEARLGANETAFEWESTLPITSALKLETRTTDTWTEFWQVNVSPVWDLHFTGLTPLFDAQSPGELIPSWRPWPGESVTLNLSRPEAVPGPSVTIGSAKYVTELGRRQRSATLELSVRATLAQDFAIGLPSAAEVTTLTVNGKVIPVRKDGAKVVVPLQALEQPVVLQWRTGTALSAHTAPDEVQLPVESVNVETIVHVPEDRWVLWAGGPVRGPAVRFWGILALSLLAAVVLARVPQSPLRTGAWLLLVIGLTQVSLLPALTVIAWLFALMLRGRDGFQNHRPWVYDLLQLLLIVLTCLALSALFSVVAAGLLGKPEMFITGNDSSETALQWFEPRAAAVLTRPHLLSVSMWWYRILMLLWALWLAASLLRWLGWGWQQFSRGPILKPLFRKRVPPAPPAPPAPAPQ